MVVMSGRRVEVALPALTVDRVTIVGGEGSSNLAVPPANAFGWKCEAGYSQLCAARVEFVGGLVTSTSAGVGL